MPRVLVFLLNEMHKYRVTEIHPAIDIAIPKEIFSAFGI